MPETSKDPLSYIQAPIQNLNFYQIRWSNNKSDYMFFWGPFRKTEILVILTMPNVFNEISYWKLGFKHQNLALKCSHLVFMKLTPGLLTGLRCFYQLKPRSASITWFFSKPSYICNFCLLIQNVDVTYSIIYNTWNTFSKFYMSLFLFLPNPF